MLSILIIDDTPEKLEDMRAIILNNFKEIRPTDIDSACCTNEGLSLLNKKQYDLLLLDLYICKSKGGKPSPQVSLDFLDTIAEFDSIHYPAHILGITRIEKIDEADKERFEESLWTLMRYGEDYAGWEDKLKSKIQYLINSKQQLLKNPMYDYDVAVITALQDPEQKWLKRVFGVEGWTLVDSFADKSNTYYEKNMKLQDGRIIRVVVAYQHQMGSTASSALTTKVLYNFRPQYLFMTGIAAAIDPKDINLGDIMVASEAWDGASGKYVDVPVNQEQGGDVKYESCFRPDPRHLAIDSSALTIINRLKENEDLLYEITKGFKMYDNDRERKRVSVHVGPMASVPAVVASKEPLDVLQKQSRKLLGIEMETYGMYYAAANAVNPRPKFTVSLKSASDYATSGKDDDYQAYASYTSAVLLKHIILKELEY